MKIIILTILIFACLFVRLVARDIDDITSVPDSNEVYFVIDTIKFEFHPYIEFIDFEKGRFRNGSIEIFFTIIDILIEIDSTTVDSVFRKRKIIYHIEKNKQIGYRK